MFSCAFPLPRETSSYTNAQNPPARDHDTVWTVTLDGQGNLALNNSQCEGINSAALPAAALQF